MLERLELLAPCVRARHALARPPGGPGSGYVVAPRLVLTSAHVVRAIDTVVEVFRPGRVGTFTGRVVWCGTPAGRDDAALVDMVEGEEA